MLCKKKKKKFERKLVKASAISKSLSSEIRVLPKYKNRRHKSRIVYFLVRIAVHEYLHCCIRSVSNFDVINSDSLFLNKKKVLNRRLRLITMTMLSYTKKYKTETVKITPKHETARR